ncbi:MAG: hypothetical protein JOY71_06640 [Acetobacteraceae bacterium]|nr:hypothetical protein [Acetobacteraceae bacterium]
MAKPYSMDLRERVSAAVVRGGLSCRHSLNSASTEHVPWISTSLRELYHVLRLPRSQIVGLLGLIARLRLMRLVELLQHRGVEIDVLRVANFRLVFLPRRRAA